MNDSPLQIAPVPRISIQAFCEDQNLVSIIADSQQDRRMGKAHVKAQLGGLSAALEAFRDAPTPNLIVIESRSQREELIAGLEELAEYCDAGTKVVVVGHVNDILLYRDLMARGVSDYLVAPLSVMGFIAAVSELYASQEGGALGRVVAVIGAKGGAGASTIAHNLAWTVAHDHDIATVLVDLDLPAGTAGLDFNQDPPQGVVEAIYSPDRIDPNFVDRLLCKAGDGDKLNLLAAPATLERVYDFEDTALDSLIDILRAQAPMTVLDIPKVWNGWTRRVLLSADDVIVVAAPDLASLRNAKNILDQLRAARPNDRAPRLVLNMIGVPKRPEIPPADFGKNVETQPSVVFPFEPKLFGAAANNGRMIAEEEGSAKLVEIFGELARLIVGRPEPRKVKKSVLAPLLSKLNRKKA
jgi:pilus assembly protein CpaE